MSVRAIEVPPKRILEVEKFHFEANFQRLNANGETPRYGEATYLVVRNKDSKVFKPAQFVPAEPAGRECVYLEEL